MTDISDGSTIATTADNAAPTSYHFDFSRFNEHLVEVTLRFTAHTDTPHLWLPAWIAGSYLMREFARNITAVHYQISETDAPTASVSYRAQKSDKNTWQLPVAKAGQALSVHYEVYCYDLSVRTAYVDQQRLYGNFTSLALAVAGQERSPVQVNLLVPAAFFADKAAQNVTLACGLAATYLERDINDNAKNVQKSSDGSTQHHYGLQAQSYDELIDYPFEIAEQAVFDFIIQDDKHQAIRHHFYLSGKHSANMGRLQEDITQICQSYVNWLGDAPFGGASYAGYTFMTYASGQDYGGLEHINSTSLITPRADLPSIDEPELPSKDYQRFLGLCSHEYFHAWWVKTVRPDVMMAVDLRREAFTPLLWVFEGFTSYVDDFMLQASGVIDNASYLTLLAEQINRYYQTHGRAHQSVAESSFDAWIKLYRSDENTSNAGISYYNKGALVALCLDLTLMQKSQGRYRLFDVIKAFYNQAKCSDAKRIGISSADLGRVISDFMPKADWQDFEQRYVNGVDELPLEPLLIANGIRMDKNKKDNTLPWGITVQEIPEGLQVTKVLRESVASAAGLSAKDVIIAIDGLKASNKQLQSVAKSALDTVSCHAFRRDELLSFEVAYNTDSGLSANPSLDNVTLQLLESGFETWLSPDFVQGCAQKV